jgi:hypothetical protein
MRHYPGSVKWDPSPVNRLIIFFVALLFESFCISNFWTRASVLVTSIVVAGLIVWRIVIRASHRSATYRDVWWYAMVAWWHVCHGQLRRLRNSARTTVELLRNLFRSDTPNDVGSVHSLAIPRGGVGSV